MSSPAHSVRLKAGRTELWALARALFKHEGVLGMCLDGHDRVVVTVRGDDSARAVVKYADRRGIEVRHVRSYEGDEVDL